MSLESDEKLVAELAVKYGEHYSVGESVVVSTSVVAALREAIRVTREDERKRTLEEAIKDVEAFMLESEDTVHEWRFLRLSIARDALEHVVASHIILERLRRMSVESQEGSK